MYSLACFIDNPQTSLRFAEVCIKKSLVQKYIDHLHEKLIAFRPSNSVARYEDSLPLKNPVSRQELLEGLRVHITFGATTVRPKVKYYWVIYTAV